MNKTISAFLTERIAAGDFPSAVYLVAEKGEIVYQDALGFAVVDPELPQEALTDTLYDLASLTKPLATGLIAAKLADRGYLRIDEPARNYLPSFNNADKADITLSQLLSHTSGLTAWKPFYLEVTDPTEILDFISGHPREFVPGSQVVYSDLNFTALMYIIEQTLGKRLKAVMCDEVIKPLELRQTCFNPLSEFLFTQIAASELGNQYEKKTCWELGYFGQEHPDRDPNAYFRQWLIHGEVHDGNAFFMFGVAGHAGLFSTAEEVFKIALQFLPEYTQILRPETCELFRTNFTKGMNEDRSFAFQLASTEGSTAGTKMSPESFGHNGFTGTSLWIDPVKDRIFVLLTNRTHNHPLPFVNINSVRRRFHDLAIEELDGRQARQK